MSMSMTSQMCWGDGNRFCPTDQELVNRYLMPKILSDGHEVREIPELDVFRTEPWNLPDDLKITPNDLGWHAFCPRYLNAGRPNRKSDVGYWKATGKSREITTQHTDGMTSIRKIFVFYKGRFPNGKNTKYVMHEFSAAIDSPNGQRTFVLCKIMKRADKNIIAHEWETIGTLESIINNEVPEEIDPEDPKYPDFLAHLNSFSSCIGQDYRP